MAKPQITKRQTKNAALTYAELDTNFQNLADATISLTAGTGGTQVTSDLNGNITLVAGTNVTLTGNNTTKTITINASGGSSPAGSNTQIQFNNNGSLGASANLTWDGTSLSATNLVATSSSGNEGGEIRLALAQTNNSLTGSVAIDIFQSQLRIFETGGSNRGVYINLASAGTGVSTNLLAGDIVNDTTPQLGGNLDTNGKSINNALGRVTIADELTVNSGINIGYEAGGSYRVESSAGLIICAETTFGGSAGPRIGLGKLSGNGFVLIGTDETVNDRVSITDVVRLNNISTTERNSITTPLNGDMIYNTTTNKFQGYANGVWVDLH